MIEISQKFPAIGAEVVDFPRHNINVIREIAAGCIAGAAIATHHSSDTELVLEGLIRATVEVALFSNRADIGPKTSGALRDAAVFIDRRTAR